MRRLGGLVGSVALVGAIAIGVSPVARAAGDEPPPQDNGAVGEDNGLNEGHLPPPVACNKPATSPGGSRVIRVLPSGPMIDGTQRFTAGVCIYLPPGYDDHPDVQYPVLYLLHGGGGDQGNWVTFGHVQETVDALGGDLIVAMPDGSDGSDDHGGGNGVWYDHPDKLAMNETYVIDHVIPYVDSHFRTIANRSGRAVAGLSNGGLGSMVFAAKHPDLFVAASTMSGNLGGYAHEYDQLHRPLYHDGNTPTPLATNLEHVDVIQRWGSECSPTGDLQVDLCATWAFEQAFRYDNGLFRDTLDALAEEHPGFYRHTYGDGQGGHAWRWWSSWLRDEHLPFLLDRLADPQPNDLADAPSPAPASFRYKSISPRFTIWGYDITVQRDDESFLELTDVTPTSMTLTGSGVVTVITPDGRTLPPVDLGTGTTTTIAT